ncbi:hypothetical protein BGZ96_004230 [Linnemannia gamsii]|uniref:F-box domain-containing protein n=1 Tax=Linnemannia gamsii TaxID=64522 RepID=A0ABQ7KHE9_9FUNG|nr:hypothetical protein BGZ96_004230 [Linnemannia gamsii]
MTSVAALSSRERALQIPELLDIIVSHVDGRDLLACVGKTLIDIAYLERACTNLLIIKIMDIKEYHTYSEKCAVSQMKYRVHKRIFARRYPEERHHRAVTGPVLIRELKGVFSPTTILLKTEMTSLAFVYDTMAKLLNLATLENCLYRLDLTILLKRVPSLRIYTSETVPSISVAGSGGSFRNLTSLKLNLPATSSGIDQVLRYLPGLIKLQANTIFACFPDLTELYCRDFTPRSIKYRPSHSVVRTLIKSAS